MNYLTDTQYFRTAFAGVILFTSIVIGLPFLSMFVNEEIIFSVVVGIIILLGIILAYMRVDLVVRELFN